MELEYGKIVTNSLKLAWKHKIMWFASMLVFGSFVNFRSFPSQGNRYSESVTEQTQVTGQNDVLGETSFSDFPSQPADLTITKLPEESTTLVQNSAANKFNDFVEGLGAEFLSRPRLLFALGLGFALFGLYSFLLRLFIHSWGISGLIGSSIDGIEDRPVTLFALGSYGRTRMKELLRFKLVTFILGFALMLSIIIFGVGFLLPVTQFYTLDFTHVFEGDVYRPSGLAIILFLLLILTTLAIIFLLKIISPYAERYIVLNNSTYFTGLKQGLRLFRQNFLKTVIMIVTNGVVSMILTLPVIIVLVGAFGGVLAPSLFSVLSNQKLVTPIYFSIVVMFLTIVFVLALLFIGLYAGYINTYKVFVWSYMYKYLSGTSTTLSIVQKPRSDEKNIGFGPRFSAMAIDAAIILAVIVIKFAFVFSTPWLLSTKLTVSILVLLAINPIQILYFTYFTHLFGGTLGKLICGVKVVSRNENKLDIKTAFYRCTVGYSFSALAFGLGFFRILKDENKNAWHDELFDTRVVKK